MRVKAETGIRPYVAARLDSEQSQSLATNETLLERLQPGAASLVVQAM